MKSESIPEISGCQSCHHSPPPTGMHDLHIFNYRDSIITCNDCHSSAFKRTFWTLGIKREKRFNLTGWDTLALDFPRFSLIRPRVKTNGYLFCNTQLRGNRLLTHGKESLEAVVKPGDSLMLTDSSIIHSSYDSVSKQFEPSSHYNKCEYSLGGDTIFKLESAKFDSTLRTLHPGDSVIIREGLNTILVLSADFNSADTIRGNFVPTTNTFLDRLDEEIIRPVSVISNNSFYVMQIIDSIYLRNELYYDTNLLAVSQDRVDYLFPDSAIQYGNNIFGENTAYHMNGKLDIKYPAGAATNFTKDTVQIVLDSLTGDTLYSVDSSGSWVPERQSCWHFSIWTAQCHIGLRKETFWYRPNYIGRL